MSVSKSRNGEQKAKLKKRLFNLRSTCVFCKRKLTMATATLEHIEPLAHGGSWTISNLTLACGPCNHDRGTMDFEMFRQTKKWRLIDNG